MYSPIYSDFKIGADYIVLHKDSLSFEKCVCVGVSFDMDTREVFYTFSTCDGRHNHYIFSNDPSEIDVVFPYSTELEELLTNYVEMCKFTIKNYLIWKTEKIEETPALRTIVDKTNKFLKTHETEGGWIV